MIELKNISAKAGDFRLSSIDLRIEEGKFHVLLGPSGSGKTVLLETIAGLKQPATGQILFDQENITSKEPELRRLSYLPQDSTLFPHKDVFENIAFGLRLREKLPEIKVQKKVKEVASILNITDLLGRGIKNLSGGEKQRVALARALVMENTILLLDEPTSSLHETMQENFVLLLKDLQTKLKVTVLMTTHHKDSAFMLADSLHFIDGGKLHLSIKAKDLFHTPLPRKVAELVGVSNLLDLKKTETVDVYRCEQTACSFHFRNLPMNGQEEFQLGLRPSEIRVVRKEENDHQNTFPAQVKRILHKETDALVVLTIPQTRFLLKMEIPLYTLHKMGIGVGKTILCRIKEGNARVVI